jgi:hypothetical protein
VSWTTRTAFPRASRRAARASTSTVSR